MAKLVIKSERNVADPLGEILVGDEVTIAAKSKTFTGVFEGERRGDGLVIRKADGLNGRLATADNVLTITRVEE